MQTSEKTSPAQALTHFRAAAIRLTKTTTGSVVLGFLALAAMSQIVVPLPFTPVPVSMGTLGAMLLGVFLGPRRGVAAAALYAVAGAAGLPVLAGFQSGYLLASFGYVLGYIAAAALVGWGLRGAGIRSYAGGLALALCSSALVYVCGVLWMIAVFGVALPAALTLGVMPFLLGDVLKSLVVAGAIRTARA